MEPFVTRIGDVTIERVVPKSGPGSGGGTFGKETKDPIPPPSVSLAKRDLDGGETISVSEDLQIFLKPPLSGTDKASTGGLKHEGHKSRDSSISRSSREASLGRGDDRMAASGTDDSDASDSGDNEDHHSGNIDEEDGMLPQAVDKADASDLQQRNKSDEQSDVMSNSKVTASSIVDAHSQSALQNSIETGAVSLEPVRTEQDKMHGDSVMGGSSVSDGKAVAEEGKGKVEEDNERGTTGPEANKRKAQVDGGLMHKKKKTSSSGKDGKDKGGSSSSDSEDGMEDSKSTVMERKLSNMRRNIREVMSESQLDEETLAAQRQEMERLRRVQEQQRIIREVQRQIALNRQNNKTQTRVISLLQGNSSLLKQIPSTSSSGSSGSTQVRLPNTVLVKLASGSGQGSGSGAQTNKKVFELLRVQKGSTGTVPRPGGRGSAMSRTVLAKPRGIGPQVHMMTPSVSIAPVMSSPRVPPPSESESEGEEDSEREMLARAAALRKVAGKGKGKDVVTISSSSDDDDCILLSEPSSGDEGEPIDDPTNSGMHTNDLYNTPDEQGRVLVNVGRPAEEPEIFLAPQIARIIKPHQIGGVRFLFDNVVESLSRFNTSTGFGCILAHSMGLGKTLQVISFCDVFLRHTSARTVLCIMPINTLQNWLAEFNMWLPAFEEVNNGVNSSSNTVGSNNSGNSSDNTAGTQQQSSPDPASDGAVDANSTPETRPRNFALHVLNDSHKSMAARSKVIQEWSKGGGVLLIGYELYRQLSLKRLYKANSKKRKRKHPDEVVDVDEDDKNKVLLDEMHAALVKPGPDLVICDEGHRIKNSHASISQALKQIRSKRRIVLTGYPLQNNLLEYWCMVDFVRPNYLGTKTEFCNMFERPIQNGQCIDSTPQDIRLMRYRAHVLHSLLEGFVQRRSHSVLQVSLPQKEEYVLLLRMTKFQRKLYDTFMNEVVRTKAVPNPLKAFAVCCKIWNHPDVLYYFLKKRMYDEDVDLDLEEATASANTPLVPGVAANPRGGPGKRGRGARGPRNLLGQSKRERKSSTAFHQSGSNKPAATITPQTVGTSTSNSSTNTNNSSQCNAVPSMDCMNAGTPLQQDPQGSNQPFNIMGQQNPSYSSTGSYPDVQHYNPNSAPPYGYPPNPSASGYDPNYPSNSYSASNTPYGTSNHNTAAPQYGGSGNYYPSTGGPANGQQGNYENNSMESYYPPGPGNNQGNGYQNSVAGNSTPYWQQPGGHGFYQHHMNTAGANGNTDQYYSGNGAGSYGGTHNGETGGSSYYVGHHPHTHQQGQYGDYGNREQGNMYHGVNASGFMGDMGQNSVGNASNGGLTAMAENSQNQSSNMMNMQQNSNMNSNMQNPGTMGNLQSSQHLSMNSMQNPVGSQQNSVASQNQNTVGNAQNAVNSMQTSVEGSLVSKNQNSAGTQQNHIGTAQSPIGNQQNATGQQQNSVDSHIPMGTQQNSVAGTQTVVGSQQNPVGTPQNSVVNPHNPVGTPQNSMVNPHNPVGTPQNSMVNPHNPVGTPQNSMVNPHNPVGLQQNPMGNTHNSMATSQNPVGTPQPLLGTQQASVGNPQSMVGTQQSSLRNSQNLVVTQQQNSVGTPQNVMANSQNPMGNNQHFRGNNALLMPQNPVVAPQNPVGVPHNPIGPSQNSVDMSQNPLQTTQNIMGTSQNPMGPPQNTVGISQSAVGNPQSSMGTLQNPVTPQQNVMGMSQNPMGTQQNPMAPPQNLMGLPQNPIGTAHNPTGTPQSPLSTQQNMLGTSNNPMGTPNAMGGVQDCIGNSQNLMANSQNSLNSFQSTASNNSQNAMNIMQNVHNHMHPHPEMGSNTSNTIRNTVQDTYSRMDPNNSSQNAPYNVGNNVNLYHHQQAVQNTSSRPCLQQGNGSDSLYGSVPANVQYLGEDMGNVPMCKTEAMSQNSVNSIMTLDGSSSSGPGAHGNSEVSMYGPPSVSVPYSSRWDDNSASGRFSTALQQPEEKAGKCEANVKEESKNVGAGRSSFIANRDKLKYGEEDQCHEQNASNSYCKSLADSPERRTSCENHQVSRESYSSNSDSLKCLGDVKTVSPGTNNEQEGKSNTVSPSSEIQQNDSIKSINSPPSSLKTEDKISLNCSNETQTDAQSIPANNYSSSNIKSDISGMSDTSVQHNAFKMESGTFKSDSLSQMETVKTFESASPHFREKEARDMKEYDLSNEHKDRKLNESLDGGRCESLSVESKDASCGTQSMDLNPNEGKHLVELGTGAVRNTGNREDPGIPYDWATELLKNYIPGSIENSAKMEVLFCILEESMALGDRVLVFSQSLFTLNLIEDFLQRTNLPGRQEKWARNWNYYRLDGSTSALEREKLINEYNSNPNIHLFLVSTRAGSLGINLVGANRVVVFDASWNPCHDTQAVCRVYRYGQKKPCFVYRLVMDNCLEKKIYDRQINKQGMADRVVDECNPDAHLSIKEVTNLCWDNEQDSEPRDFSAEKDKYIDVVMQKLLQKFGTRLSKEPFQHESLLVDRKEKKLSQAEKRLAKRSYELEKQANINYSHRPQYSYYPGNTTAVGNPGMQGTGLQIRAIRTDASGGVMPKPVASVRPMQAELSQQLERGQTNRSTVTTLNTGGRSRWIPAEVWQRQGMSAQEMTLPLDVVIPTNSPDRASIVLKAGQRVMVLKSPKGIYMQLENGKIIAIRTAFKVGGAGKGSGAQHQECKPASEKAEINAPDYKKESNVTAVNRTASVAKVSNVLPFKNNSAITIIPKNPQPQQRGTGKPMGRIGGNSSGGGIIKQDVTVKPWGSRTGTSVGDVVSVPVGGNRHIGSQQPMAQARPYFHRTNTSSSADVATAKPYYHRESSSDHGMMGHHTSDEGSSGAENMASTPCGEDRDGMDGGVLKSPSSDDFNQDNSLSSHAFGSIQESNLSNRPSYDGHLGDDMVHDAGSSMSVTYGNHSDQGVQEPNMTNSYGRQLGQDIRDSSVAVNRTFRRQMDQGLQGAGNIGHAFVRQTDQRVQETSVSVNHAYGRQMDQGMHDPSGVSHRYGRHVEQTYHDSSAGGNPGFGRQVDQSIQDTGSINRSFGRQTHSGMPYSQQNQAGGYDEHKDTNFNRSDAASNGRYCHTETDSGTNSSFHGPYEDNWQQGQSFRGMSRVSGGTHGHDGDTSDGRNYQQPFKGSQRGVEKHSLADNSTREKPHSSFTDYSHRQQHQEPESPTFRSEVTDSAASGNDSGVEILPLPTPRFTPASKELLPQQSVNLNTPHGKTTSLKNYRHNSFNAQLHGRDIESGTSSENTVAPIRRNVPEKPLSAEHYMKSPQQTSYSSDIKSPSSFQKSNDDLKVSNQNIPVSAFPHAGNLGNLTREDSSSGVTASPFVGTGNAPVSQRTLHSAKNRQKNPPNIGRFNTEVNSGGNFSANVIPPTPATKSKRGNNRGEQQHFQFESHDATSDASRINPQQQQQLPGKSATRNQIFPMQPQPYHSHTSPQQAPSRTPPSSNPTNTAATSVSKKGRGNKSVSSDRSPSYSGGGANTESDSQHHTDVSNSQQSSPQNIPVQTPHSVPVFPPNPQYPAFDSSSNKPVEPYSSPMYAHQQYYPAPGYYGGFSGPQQPPVAFGGNPYYSGESQYGTGRVDSSEPAMNKHIQKGNQPQSGNSPPQQQQQQQQQPAQAMSQSTTPSKTQLPVGIGSQKKDQSNQLGSSAPASDSPTKAAASVTNPSTPTTIRDMASPSSTSGGSRSGNNSARSTPATISSTNIMQEPNSPQLHFNTPTSGSSTSLEDRSPVQYNAAMTANPTPLDPKSPLQYNSSTAGGNSSSSTAPSLQYSANASSSNFSAGTPSTPQSGIIPQTPYEPMMLGGYPAGAGGSGYAPAPPPPPPPPPPGMGYGSYSNPANQYEADYARASMYSAFHRPDPHPHPFAPGHAPGFLPPPQSANYYPQNMYGPAPYGTPDPAYYSNPFLNAMHQHPYPTLPGTAQNPGPHPQ